MKQSNKKPFLVNVEIEFAIFAESEKDIYKHPELIDAIQEGLNPSCISFIEPLKRIPDGWDENCYVYGTKNMDCDITIKEALNWENKMDGKDFKMNSDSEMIIHKISAMVASAAKEDQSKISIPLDQISYLVDSIRYAYATGVVSGCMDRSLSDPSLNFCNYFHEKYKTE